MGADTSWGHARQQEWTPEEGEGRVSGDEDTYEHGQWMKGYTPRSRTLPKRTHGQHSGWVHIPDPRNGGHQSRTLTL